MTKKRSIGVTIFGWWYVVTGALGILNIPFIVVMINMPSIFPQMSSIFTEQFSEPFYIFYIIAGTIATLVAGIGLLKLKSWARKLVIIICVVGPIYSIFASTKMIMYSSKIAETSFSGSELPKNAPPETIIAMKAFTQAIMIGSMIIGIIFGLGFVIFTIWFFMRKSVREQFQPDLTTAQIK